MRLKAKEQSVTKMCWAKKTKSAVKGTKVYILSHQSLEFNLSGFQKARTDALLLLQ